MIKNKSKNGFTLVEVLISSALTIVLLSLITGFFYSFNKASNFRIIKMELNSSLRPVIERLERELASTIKIIRTTTTNTLNGVNFDNGSSYSQLLVGVLAYDEQGNPMFESNGSPKQDLIGLKLSDAIPQVKVYRSGISYNLKKITMTVQPAEADKGLDGTLGTSDDIKSARKPLKNQIIFTSLMPMNSTSGVYTLPDANTEYQTGSKIFTYLSSSKSELDPTISSNAGNVSSIKINLLGEKTFESKSLTARQETEILFRNF
ncbi:MAG: prepilin-type N-terminal cleavage/methylation domain-containing protein [Candidatus Sericytochromatia bacterium]